MPLKFKLIKPKAVWGANKLRAMQQKKLWNGFYSRVFNVLASIIFAGEKGRARRAGREIAAKIFQLNLRAETYRLNSPGEIPPAKFPGENPPGKNLNKNP